uniref:Methyltransferase type 11 domain-containing protein n=1 Tax=Polytomella parva TaxID=51329 RepID=A0A7S0UQY9_9CHLO|mmetsp:Transcript_18101/g.33061  ORF Transcript_18101/g.33061 Transcript_18101/m.33061 type:complete len:480 (+) Transcript_18101:46-1485(+)
MSKTPPVTTVFKTFPKAQKPRKVPFQFSKRVLGTGAALLFGASSYAFYRYASAHKIPTADNSDPTAAAEYRAYDVIAKKYDEAVSMEEWSLWYWMMRRQLLKVAEGDVLEVSSGTGRNLEYYPLSKIASLTLTDISDPMLRVCEDKYFDELKLGYQYPDTKVYFSIADGHCLCGDDEIEVKAEPVVEVDPNEPYRVTRELEGSGSMFNIFRVIFQTDGKIKMPEKESPEEDSEAKEAVVEEEEKEEKDEVVESPSSDNADEDIPTTAFDISSHSRSHSHPHPSSASSDASPSACTRCDGLGRSYHHLERCRKGVTESGLRLVRFKPQSFDTVVDAFGLCSHEDPVKVLRQMASVLRPGGKILLLEHGKSTSSWLNGWLNGGAEDHHDKWGCFWNRDIEKIVEKAGLDVVQATRWHFGTSYFMICEPKEGLLKELEEERLARVGRGENREKVAMKRNEEGTGKVGEVRSEMAKKKRFYFF